MFYVRIHKEIHKSRVRVTLQVDGVYIENFTIQWQKRQMKRNTEIEAILPTFITNLTKSWICVVQATVCLRNIMQRARRLRSHLSADQNLKSAYAASAATHAVYIASRPSPCDRNGLRRAIFVTDMNGGWNIESCIFNRRSVSHKNVECELRSFCTTCFNAIALVSREEQPAQSSIGKWNNKKVTRMQRP